MTPAEKKAQEIARSVQSHYRLVENCPVKSVMKTAVGYISKAITEAVAEERQSNAQAIKGFCECKKSDKVECGYCAVSRLIASPRTHKPAEGRPDGRKQKLYRYKLIQDGVVVASVECEDKERAKDEIRRYAMTYASDGPVEIRPKLYAETKSRPTKKSTEPRGRGAK